MLFYFTLCYIISCYVMLYCVTFCYILLYCTMSCYIMSYYVTVCYSIFYYRMLCYILFSTFPPFTHLALSCAQYVAHNIKRRKSKRHAEVLEHQIASGITDLGENDSPSTNSHTTVCPKRCKIPPLPSKNCATYLHSCQVIPLTAHHFPF